jgi:hypothetical protein
MVVYGLLNEEKYRSDDRYNGNEDGVPINMAPQISKHVDIHIAIPHYFAIAHVATCHRLAGLPFTLQRTSGTF